MILIINLNYSFHVKRRKLYGAGFTRDNPAPCLDILVTRLSPRHKKKSLKTNDFIDLMVLKMAGVTGLEPVETML